MRLVTFIITGILAGAAFLFVGVESASKHNPGEDCLQCHSKKEFKAAGTVFKNYNGSKTKKKVSIFLVDKLGAIIDLGETDSSGNFAVTEKIPNGKYLIQVGDRRSKSWHKLPKLRSCNSCHVPGGNGTVQLEERHTWLPVDNDCTTCHFYPANFDFDELGTPGTLNGKKVKESATADPVQFPFGTYTFKPDNAAITSLRPDIFAPGFYSFFDVLVHVCKKENISLKYHFDEAAGTHIIDSISGQDGPWWYGVSYDGGKTNSPERNNYRMDEYLYKSGSRLFLMKIPDNTMNEMLSAFRDEITKEKNAGPGKTVVASVSFRIQPSNYEGNPKGSLRNSWSAEFKNVTVTAHNLRAATVVQTAEGPALAQYAVPNVLTPQPFQPGVITSIDVILSLEDQGELDAVLSAWMEKVAGHHVRSYYVQQLGRNGKVTHASGMQGFVYQAGYISPNSQPNGERNLHIPCDTRVLHATDFENWRWLELGPPVRGEGGGRRSTTADELDCEIK